ncbi:MAG: SMI1/KNR4 family protein [Deltaproteobacteria bacterium]|nr:SMI1/KNR4 family protein [Deltaproteobacteria bacterium]
MQDLWERLEAHANKHGRSLKLRAGASEEAIAAAEQAIGIAFPADYRASLALHDGQDPDAEPFEWMPGCSPLASVAAIAAQWKDEQEWVEGGPLEEHTPEINNVLKHPRRIPIAGTRWWDGDNTYLDLVPAKAGTVGQLITFYTECDMTLLGPSFRAALESYLAALDGGDWIYDAAQKNVHHKAEPPNTYPNEGYEFGVWVEGAGLQYDGNSGKHTPFLATPVPAAAEPQSSPSPRPPAPAKPTGAKQTRVAAAAKPAAKAKPTSAAKPTAKAKPATKAKAAAKAKPAARTKPAARSKSAKSKPVAKAKPKKKPAKKRR